MAAKTKTVAAPVTVVKKERASRLMDIATDSAQSVVHGTTYFVCASFVGIDKVATESGRAGRVQAHCYARDLRIRIAARNGLTLAEYDALGAEE